MVVSGNFAEFLLKFLGSHDVVFVAKLFGLFFREKLRGNTVEVVENHHGSVQKTSILVIDRLARTAVNTTRNAIKSRLSSFGDTLLDTVALLRRSISRKLPLGKIFLAKDVLSGTKGSLHTAVWHKATSRVRGLEVVSLDVARDERGKDTRSRHALGCKDVNVILELLTLRFRGVKRSKVGTFVEGDKLVRDVEKRVKLAVGASSFAFALGEDLAKFSKLRDVGSGVLANIATLDGMTTRDLESLVSRELTKFRSQTNNSLMGLLEILDVLRKFFGGTRTVRARSSYRSRGKCGCHFYKRILL